MKSGFNINFCNTLKIAIIIYVGGFLFNQANANGETLISDQTSIPKWHLKSFAPEQKLMKSIRNSLAGGEKVVINPDLDMDYNPSISQIYLTLFQEGQKLIRWGSRKPSIEQSIIRNCQKIKTHKRFRNFDIENPQKCRILLEIVTSEHPVDINKVSTLKFDANRFEPGITGFKFKYKEKLYYYMPTDATVHSHLNLKHTLNYISKKVGVSRLTNKITKRIEILKRLPIEFSMIASRAFITFGENVLPLYRGYPVPVEFSRYRILETTKKSVDWVIKNMSDNGKFLYYYDGVKDTIIDHQHRNMTDPLYYNILRHSGGTITLLRMYEFTKDPKYLKPADKSLEFLLTHIRSHQFKGNTAYYVFYNKKSKLGGTGVALTAFMRYYMLTKDPKYNRYIFGMARHLLSQITKDGEMMGYYIHPLFNDGRPISNPSPSEKKQLFSFYYPGEALLGLALFEREMDLDMVVRKEIRTASKKALEFLVNIRPYKYRELFLPLPADGWLMQAIEEWAGDTEFQEKEYLDFVFNDAKQMISHMYKPKNSPYFDYPGTFYYVYGDHCYPDGARAEGLFAAYALAKKTGRNELADYFLRYCKMAAQSLLFTYNSKQSTFMHKYPHKSIGSFRFKFTRQWMRIDSVQHTACFFVRLYFEL